MLKKLQKAVILSLITVVVVIAQDNKTIDIKGTITAGADDKSMGISKGDPIIGATIIVDGTTKGTTADIDGNYELKSVPIGSKLKITFAGLKTEEFIVDGSKTTFTSTMKADDAILIDEVVAIGYGEVKRSQVTGSNVSVGAKDMSRTINQDLSQALQGRAAGVSVTQTSGAPGAASSVNIRGVGSLNGSQPLYVIDGVPLDVTNGNVQNFNPADVETMEVLKDAAATAIYGSRGGNGVVLITTKRGKEGAGRIEFDAMYGVQNVWKKMDVLNADQYKEYIRDQYRSTGTEIPRAFVTTNEDTLRRQQNTNWQDQMLRQGNIQNYNIRASGGSKIATYSIGLGYFRNDGTLQKSDYDRYTLRINTDITPKKWLKVGESMSFTRESNNSGTDWGTAMNMALKGNPLLPVYNTNASQFGGPVYDSSLDPSLQKNGFARPINTVDPLATAPNNQNLYGANDMMNPVALNTFTSNKNVNYRIFGNVFAEWEIGQFLGINALKGLKARASFGTDVYSGFSKNIREPFEAGIRFNDNEVPFNREVSENRFTNFSSTTDYLLTYSKTAGDHDLSAVAGFSAQYFKQENTSGQARDFAQNLNVFDANIKTDRNTNYLIGGNLLENGLVGYLGRVNYSYKNTFLVTANARYDRSSRFGANNRAGFFPSVSVGWRINNMSFMKNIKMISDLKIRAGYGQTGNQEIGNFRYVSLIYPGIIRYPLANGVIYNGNVPTRGPENPNLKWETITQYNVGIDLGLYKNKILFTVDAYLKESSDMLVPVPLPALAGATDAPFFGQPTIVTNIGKISNQGLELALTYRSDDGPFKYSVSPNVSFISNKVIALSTNLPTENLVDGNNVSYSTPGFPAAYFNGYTYDGVIKDKDDSTTYVGNSKANPADPTSNTLNDVSAPTVAKRPGDAKFKDISGPDGTPDGKITNADRTKIGSPIPSMIFGFSFDASFKGFDFKLFLQGVTGNSIYNEQRRQLEGMQNTGGPKDANQLASVANRWTPTNRDTDIPRALNADLAQNGRPSSRWIEDGSYMRIKNIQLGYSLPSKLLQKWLKTEDGVNLRFYVQVQNLLTLTAYKGFDPELANFARNSNGQNAISAAVAGYDNGQFPQPRTYSVGLQFSF